MLLKLQKLAWNFYLKYGAWVYFSTNRFKKPLKQVLDFCNSCKVQLLDWKNLNEKDIKHDKHNWLFVKINTYICFADKLVNKKIKRLRLKPLFNLIFIQYRNIKIKFNWKSNLHLIYNYKPLFKPQPKQGYNVNISIIQSPILFFSGCGSKLVKSFIRNSKKFNKTKYSIIRQECKNIVTLVLLINILSVFTINTLFFNFNFFVSYKTLFIVFYIISNLHYLSRAKLQIKRFFGLYL